MSRPDPLDQRVIAEFRARGGIVGATSDLSLLRLHHVGAKSGMERLTPLAYWPDRTGQQRRTLIDAITAQSTSAAAAVKHAPREIPVVILELLEKRQPTRSPRRDLAR
jgi:hypothetical protein